jgi:carbamoyl-phosphate synthase large subunit
MVCETCFQPEADRLARDIVTAVGLDYVVNVQLKQDRNGELKLLEINPRIPGTIGLTICAGVNMPYFAVKLSLGEDPGAIPLPRYGLKLIRMWDKIVFDSSEITQLTVLQ